MNNKTNVATLINDSWYATVGHWSRGHSEIIEWLRANPEHPIAVVGKHALDVSATEAHFKSDAMLPAETFVKKFPDMATAVTQLLLLVGPQ